MEQNYELGLYQANKDIKEIKEIEATIEEIKSIAAIEINKINEKMQSKVEDLEAKISKCKENLLVFCSGIEMKETKTQKKKELLDGTIIIKKPSTKIVTVKDEFLNWTIKNRPDFVEVKKVQSLKWAEFKKHLKIEGETIIDKETGEVIEADGIGIEIVPQTLEIKF